MATQRAPTEAEWSGLTFAWRLVKHVKSNAIVFARSGHLLGVGAGQMSRVDASRIAADKAKLSAAYTARGLVPESGGTWLLPRIVGWSKAAELLFTARTLTAQQSVELGLVSLVVSGDELMDAAMGLAGEIADNAPLAIRAAKRMMRHAMTEDFEDHVQRQYLALLPLFATSDFREGLASYLEKRPPEFRGR